MGRWITIKGTHIFIKDGQTVEEAIESKFGNQQDFKEKEEKNSKISYSKEESDEFFDTIGQYDWEKVEKNEKLNSKNAKSTNRKDKYGNYLVSDDAFKEGQKGAKMYIDAMTKYTPLDKLKNSNVFLGGLNSAISKKITESGYNPDLDITYTDLNEIAGSVLGEEVDFEQYEANATKGFTGKEYKGFTPSGNVKGKTDSGDFVSVEGASAEFQRQVNEKYENAVEEMKKRNLKIPQSMEEAEKLWGKVLEDYEEEPIKNNEVWNKKYQPIYDLYENVFDKFSTDEWVNKKLNKNA